MIKHLAIAFAFSGILAGSAFAQTTPSPAPTPAPTEQVAPAPTPAPAPAPAADAKAADTPDACLEAVADLVKSAEDKKVADDKIEKIEDLLIKMEGHCEGKRFPEAQAVATDIKSLIEKQ